MATAVCCKKAKYPVNAMVTRNKKKTKVNRGNLNLSDMLRETRETQNFKAVFC